MSKLNINNDILTLNKDNKAYDRKGSYTKILDHVKDPNERQDSVNHSLSKSYYSHSRNGSLGNINNSKQGLIDNEKESNNLINKLYVKNNFNGNRGSKFNKSKSFTESENDNVSEKSNQIIELKKMNKSFKSKTNSSFAEDIEDEKKDIRNNRKIVKKEKICDSDTEDEGTDNEKEIKCIILPDNSIKKKWDLIIAVILIYTAIVLPFRVSFIDNDSEFYKNLDIFFDCMFGTDLILCFFSAYVDSEDNIIKNRQVSFI